MSVDKFVAQKEYEIKGETHKIQIMRLPASEGIVLGTKLLKLVLPVIGGFADEMFADESTSKEVPKTFSEMAQRVIFQLDSFDSGAIMKRLLKDASIDGRAISFDEYFMGNYGELLIVIEFALRENFQSFFEGTGLKTRFFNALGVMTETDQAESDEQ